MNASELSAFTLALVTPLATGAVAVWVGKLVLNRFSEATLRTYEARLQHATELHKARLVLDNAKAVELLRSDLSLLAHQQAHLLTLQSQGFHTSHPEVIASIKEVWAAVIEIESKVGPIVAHFAILKSEDFRRKSILDWIPSYLPISSLSEVNEIVLPLMQQAQSARPFVGDALWLHFQSYRAFMGRLAFKTGCQRDDSSFKPWNIDLDGSPDAHLEQLYRAVVPNDRLNGIDLGAMSAPQRIQKLMIEAIVADMEAWIFGGAFLSMSLDQKAKLDAAIAAVEASPKSPGSAEAEA